MVLNFLQRRLKNDTDSGMLKRKDKNIFTDENSVTKHTLKKIRNNSTYVRFTPP